MVYGIFVWQVQQRERKAQVQYRCHGMTLRPNSAYEIKCIGPRLRICTCAPDPAIAGRAGCWQGHGPLKWPLAGPASRPISGKETVRLPRVATGWCGYGGAPTESRDRGLRCRPSRSLPRTDGAKTLPTGATTGRSGCRLASPGTDCGVKMPCTMSLSKSTTTYGPGSRAVEARCSSTWQESK
jgi:hypothetical protein